MRVELIADGGRAAACGEFFRSEPFLEAEGVTHSLVLGPARVPLVVREIEGPGGLHDATSPYGYPGATLTEGEDPPDPAQATLGEAGLVSIFLRERLGPPGLAGGTERSRVFLHDPGRPRGVRRRVLEQIGQAERAGWRADAVPGSEVGEREIEAFHRIYTQTMRRTDAAPRYFFDLAYLAAVLSFEASWLVQAELHGEVGAAAIVVRSDDHLHYFLGGTSDDALEASPFKNVVGAMLDLADRESLPLNLGGGVRPGDGLERFKRGFANADAPFVTHELVGDPGAYGRLSAGREAASFFPAYRA